MKHIYFSALMFCFLLLIGCSEETSQKVLSYQENNEITGEEREELIGDISPTIYESGDRDNKNAEEIYIQPVDKQGEKLTPPAGRYIITAGDLGGEPQSGRVLVYDANGLLLIEELLDSYIGVGSVTVNLNGSHTVHVDGIDELLVSPVPTTTSNELTAGIWQVSEDIDAGNYTVVATEYSFGYLQIFEKGETPRVFEILNNPTNSTINLQLKEGQILKISGVDYLKFE